MNKLALNLKITFKKARCLCIYVCIWQISCFSLLKEGSVTVYCVDFRALWCLRPAVAYYLMALGRVLFNSCSPSLQNAVTELYIS